MHIPGIDAASTIPHFDQHLVVIALARPDEQFTRDDR